MVMSGPDDGMELILNSNISQIDIDADYIAFFTIGRRETCDICIPFDTSVSRLHANIAIDKSYNITLMDRDSRNGTFVGRQRVKDAITMDTGTLFRIGNTWLRVQSLTNKDE